MKTLNIFLEGLLDKSNKADVISDIDVTDPEELASAFPHRTSLGQDIYLPSKNGLCMIHGLGSNGKTYAPMINLFVKINRVLYRFNILICGLDHQTEKYFAHDISVRTIDEGEMLNFHKNGYLWKVDINDAKAFLIKQFELYNKVNVVGNLSIYKQFTKWLGVKLDVKH